MREAAMWRKMQGISMEGDEELLAGKCGSGVKAARKRDEWMTELPPERKHVDGLMLPSERAWKAKMEYLQAYNEFASLASNEEERKRSLEEELMDNYKKDKQSKSLLQKHQEEIRSEEKNTPSNRQRRKTGWGNIRGSLGTVRKIWQVVDNV
ncbi:hypothetical protein J5N97_000483 [Dioscorea zingiberensis]|uniref:DUF3752 domain-containing protein n=1 Tax=Dioscorea zingiberensis TaxID=325984 RepID=A0A9D5BS64_9LILI|nr:hypothetical protein J5N97_000483 [Dioscorea zingiberensis]